MDWYIGTEWKDTKKGLTKRVVDLKFTKLEKPNITSKVRICVEEVANLNGRPSNYLAGEGAVQDIQIGSATTPVDCYVELLVQQMIVGERASCRLDTRAGAAVTFVLRLDEILETKLVHKLTAKEMYDLALKYKENGVAMFKLYPKFAHEYFSRGSKCMLSYKPFEPLTLQRDEVDGSEMQQLLNQLKTNLAACLLTENRLEDVIFQTAFVENAVDANEKAVYRRAIAFFELKDYDEARRLIETVKNYQEKPGFHRLYQRVAERWKASNKEYKNVVQRMFNS